MSKSPNTICRFLIAEEIKGKPDHYTELGTQWKNKRQLDNFQNLLLAYNLAYLLHNSHKCECSQNAIQQTDIQNSEKPICLKTTCPTKNTSFYVSFSFGHWKITPQWSQLNITRKTKSYKHVNKIIPQVNLSLQN